MGERRTQENPSQYGGMLEASEAQEGMAHLKFRISSVERKQKRLVRVNLEKQTRARSCSVLLIILPILSLIPKAL